MKFRFEPDLDFQHDAIQAVCDLFRGQELSRSEFSVTPATSRAQYVLGMVQSDLGVGNALTLSDDDVLRNLRAVQLRNGIAQSTALASGDFTIEMETGTGKTYVYLRSIYELNKRYGFTKFVIVVPSVAIKEGVYKTLEITAEHFRSLYAGVPCEYYLYDSARLGEVRNFATNATLQIMVVTVGAINKKDVNNLYKDAEQTGGERPIDLIKATRPVLIVDEPQSVDGGLRGAGKSALEAMNPLCTLRYSATHIDKHQMVYRLDAVDAYERKLVKQIEVAAATIEDAHNRPFVRLVSTSNRRNTISARVLVDADNAGKVRRTEVTVADGDDLERITGRALYKGLRIGEIRASKTESLLELRIPGAEQFLRPGEAWGDVEPLAVQRQMIRRTIKEHLEKARRLHPRGIKVLSLFFVDAVAQYRRYDASGNPVKGPYATIFEEEYQRWIRHPDFQDLGLHGTTPVAQMHDGYFSIDRRGGWTDTDDNNQANRENAERAYHLIMREKEALLDLNTPLAFIFSHSALREGWDNPNVFQICTLRDINTERERRQTIGRGLRLCVDAHGERVRGFDVNTLTVIANESYEQFAEALQNEIARETGVQFGLIEPHQFTGCRDDDDTGLPAIDTTTSHRIWEHLRSRDYITSDGRVRDVLKDALVDGTVSLPAEVAAYRRQITSVIRRHAGRIEVRNADERRRVVVRRAVLDSLDFRELWERIKYKTGYRVQFDNARLIDNCIDALRTMPAIPRARLQWRKADIAIGRGGVEAIERSSAAPTALDESDIVLPDILTELQDRTQLTRRSIQRVLTASGRLDDFKRNPQRFIEAAAAAINHCRRHAIIDNVAYQPLGDKHYYAQELFESEELTGYIKGMLVDSGGRSVYEQVVYDSATEARFAQELAQNEAVKVFAKLPSWFVIPTPLGPYRPDWAVLVRDGEHDRVFLVIETKGSQSPEDFRYGEQGKIDCGRAHFRALRVRESPAEYVVATTLEEALSRIS